VNYSPFPALTSSSTLVVVAPSSPFPHDSFERGVARLGSHFKLQVNARIFEADRYLAGTDAARANELVEAIHSNAAGVIAARGGYGLTRIIDRVNLADTAPKALIGFSDFTALHLLAQKSGWQSVHAPVLTQLSEQPEQVVAALASILQGYKPRPLSGTRCIVGGIGQGPLLGGNLAVLTRLIGTPALPSFDGAVLLLEDVGERPYQLDRMLTHLRQAGLLRNIAGVVLGDFTHCEEKNASFTSVDVLADFFRALGKPCAAGFAIGHGEVNMPVLLGAPVSLDAALATLSFL
jgi:muramoyltetrapeptide carboxypeptidase